MKTEFLFHVFNQLCYFMFEDIFCGAECTCAILTKDGVKNTSVGQQFSKCQTRNVQLIFYPKIKRNTFCNVHKENEAYLKIIKIFKIFCLFNIYSDKDALLFITKILMKKICNFL